MFYTGHILNMYIVPHNNTTDAQSEHFETRKNGRRHFVDDIKYHFSMKSFEVKKCHWHLFCKYAIGKIINTDSDTRKLINIPRNWHVNKFQFNFTCNLKRFIGSLYMVQQHKQELPCVIQNQGNRRREESAHWHISGYIMYISSRLVTKRC